MKILITAGTTHEHIDPVRFISNASSGLQGVLIAEAAIEEGNEVVLIIGPNSLNELYELKFKCDYNHNKLKVVNIVSAEDMYKAAMEYYPSCDVAICSAAVGDYRVKDIVTDKIKRNGDSIILELIPNPDIAKSLGEIKTNNQKLIGFALETSNGIENAKSKIVKKNLDWVVLNETSASNPAFGSNRNIVKFIHKDGTIQEFDEMPKKDIACKILKLINI
jgi:phosphopantothenoylcysteine decarboxylase/phosphopantothenate--cysteine ligase